MTVRFRCMQKDVSFIMLLQMTLNDNVLDAIPVDPGRCKGTGYLEAMVACLKSKHFEAIGNAGCQPCFVIIAGSRMNDNDIV
jgi:hypothetical protein